MRSPDNSQIMEDLRRISRSSEVDLATEIIQARYPAQQAAILEPILAKTPDPEYMKDRNWDLPNFLDGQAPRLLILAGLGNIEFLKKLTSDKKLGSEIIQFIFIENDPEAIRHILNDPYGVSLLASQRVRFIFGADEKTFKPLLFNILKNPEYSRVMECGQFFVNEEESDEDRLSLYNSLGPQINETIFHVYHNYGRIDDSLEGVRATLQNREYVEDSAGIRELKGLMAGRNAAVVGAGPSLDAALPVLKENADKFVIFAADAAVKPLLKAGITPHFTTSIERGNIYQKPFWEGLPENLETELVFYPVVHNEVLALYPGPKRVAYRNYAYYAYWEACYPKGMLSSGGSTSHLAFNLANFMGAESITMIGIDHSYEEGEEGLFRSHCHGLGHDYWATYKPIEDFSNKEKGGTHQPPYKVKSMDGSTVVTNITYHQWSKEFGEIILNKGLVGKVTITAPKAVVIPGAVYASLETVCESLEKPAQPLKIPRTLTPPKRQPFDHNHILKSLEGWQRILEGLKEELPRLKSLTDPLEKSFVIHYMNETLTYKLEQDTLFTSIVCQNCGYELYKSKNIWYSGVNGPEGDDRRIEYLEKIIPAYSETITKLKEIFENE